MIRHLSSVAEIVEDVDAAVKFYQEVLGLQVEHKPGDDYATIQMPGVLHYGIWSRRAAAESTFGDANATDRIPLGFTVGFEVDSVADGERIMKEKDWKIAQPTKKEAWGQITNRFFAPSGALCELSEAPWARRLAQNVRAENEAQAET
jgi:catechol 2,3-dioxygenase-like lactoylglutathione lyase family enzyme